MGKDYPVLKGILASTCGFEAPGEGRVWGPKECRLRPGMDSEDGETASGTASEEKRVIELFTNQNKY
jgi:hypothetical protein